MISMLVKHNGKVGTLTKSSVKFNKHLDDNKTWPKAKEWFRDALENINVAVDIKSNAAQQARDEITNGMSKSFDMLVQSEVAN